MVGVYPAGFAEVMLGRHSAPLIEREVFLSFDDFDPVQRRAHGDSSTAATERTITASRSGKPVGKRHRELDGSTMTGEFMGSAHLRLLIMGMRVGSSVASGWGG